jgi:hypothetical protein
LLPSKKTSALAKRDKTNVPAFKSRAARILSFDALDLENSRRGAVLAPAC